MSQPACPVCVAGGRSLCLAQPRPYTTCRTRRRARNSSKEHLRRLRREHFVTLGPLRLVKSNRVPLRRHRTWQVAIRSTQGTKRIVKKKPIKVAVHPFHRTLNDLIPSPSSTLLSFSVAHSTDTISPVIASRSISKSRGKLELVSYLLSDADTSPDRVRRLLVPYSLKECLKHLRS